MRNLGIKIDTVSLPQEIFFAGINKFVCSFKNVHEFLAVMGKYGLLVEGAFNNIRLHTLTHLLVS